MGGFWLSRAVAVAAALAVMVSVAASAAEPPSPEARAQLSPTGALRAAFILSNIVLVARDPASDELHGVAPELARRLAESIGAPLQPVIYTGLKAYGESLGTGRWDIAFVSREPERATMLDLSAPFLSADYVFLAGPGKPFREIRDLDRPNLLIGVPADSAAEAFLTGKFTRARLYRLEPGATSAVAALNSGEVVAYGENAEFVSGIATRVPGSHLLDGTFMTVQMAVGISRGRPAALAHVNAMLKDAKTSGFLQQAIDRAGLHGVHVVP